MKANVNYQIIYSSVLLIMLFFSCKNMKPDVTEDNVQNISKKGCLDSGGTVVNSGYSGWWFCCGASGCYSCTGEEGIGLHVNCTLAKTYLPNEPLDKNDSIPKMLISFPDGKRLVNIPTNIWEKLNFEEKKLAINNKTRL